jgi:hypothetical protein
VRRALPIVQEAEDEKFFLQSLACTETGQPRLPRECHPDFSIFHVFFWVMFDLFLRMGSSAMAALQRCHPVIPRWSVHSNKVSLVSAAELKQVGAASPGRLQRLVPWNKMKKSDYLSP